MTMDPVCGMQVDEKQTTFKSNHEGKTYYFCSTDCKQEFDANPEDYTETGAEESVA